MADRSSDYVAAFIATSTQHRRQFLDVWREVSQNFMVQVEPRYSRGVNTSPYGRPIYRSRRSQVMLKDPETFKVITTYAAKLTKALFGDPKAEYIKCEPIGWEDVNGAEAATRYLRYIMRMPGHYRTMVEATINALLHGTAIIESPWRYEEVEVSSRSVESRLGVEYDSVQQGSMPYYDDVCLGVIDVEDFFYDPSRYRIEDMPGVAKRFRMNASEARRTTKFNQEAVEAAIKKGPSGRDNEERFREGVEQPIQNEAMSEFKDMIGYEYSGWVPWQINGSNRVMITLLNGEKVFEDKYPYFDPMLHFHTLIINPLQGRFYGISPAEVIRSDQSFADAVKTLLAEAIIRQVHPPIAYDSDSEFDPVKLREWKADLPIPIRGGPASIGTLRYDANVNNGFAMLTGLKQSMQEAAGNTGIQGEQGPDREAATVGSQRVELALDRVEYVAQFLETDGLPSIGRACLRRGQQFLTTEELIRRIGEMPEPVWIGDIMGDFDVQFSGSRKASTRAQKLQMTDRLQAMGAAIPAFAMQVPWDTLAQKIIGDWMDLPEVAAQIGTAATIQQNTALGAMAAEQGGAGQNGVASQAAPPGLPPAQTFGAAQ